MVIIFKFMYTTVVTLWLGHRLNGWKVRDSNPSRYILKSLKLALTQGAYLVSGIQHKGLINLLSE